MSTGVVWVDGRRAGYLIGGKPRTVRLHPGDRSVAVRLDSLRGSEWAGTASLGLGEGDHVELVCGRKRGSWSVAKILFLVLYSASCWAILSAGFLIAPSLRTLLISVWTMLPLNGLAVGLAYRVIELITSKVGVAILALWVCLYLTRSGWGLLPPGVRQHLTEDEPYSYLVPKTDQKKVAPVAEL
jgi:hypothetical protein